MTTTGLVTFMSADDGRCKLQPTGVNFPGGVSIEGIQLMHIQVMKEIALYCSHIQACFFPNAVTSEKSARVTVSTPPRTPWKYMSRPDTLLESS